MTEIQQWADAAQFKAEPMREPGISVSLLWMTPDPLGAIAAACRMYEGYPTYDLNDITDERRSHYFEQVEKTHLKAPLEFVKFHFFLEGVDRAFTHQMVRQRTAVYAQESMRFAVKEDLSAETPLPPSLMGLKEDDPRVLAWRRALSGVEEAYNQLVNSGVPAEDARGLLPHATTTRLNYSTDLRALLDHAGNRLCTQAQYHWRVVFTKIRQAIREFPMEETKRSWTKQTGGHPDDMPFSRSEIDNAWQFDRLAELFLPVCYQMGKCPFKAQFDRGCSIRERVDGFEEKGVPSSQWHEGWESEDSHLSPSGEPSEKIDPIDPAEWLLNPDAARVRVGDEYGDQSRRRG